MELRDKSRVNVIPQFLQDNCFALLGPKRCIMFQKMKHPIESSSFDHHSPILRKLKLADEGLMHVCLEDCSQGMKAAVMNLIGTEVVDESDREAEE